MDTPVKLKLDRNARFLPSNQTPTEIIKTICAFILYYTLIYNLLEPLQTWISAAIQYFKLPLFMLYKYTNPTF